MVCLHNVLRCVPSLGAGTAESPEAAADDDDDENEDLETTVQWRDQHFEVNFFFGCVVPLPGF